MTWTQSNPIWWDLYYIKYDWSNRNLYAKSVDDFNEWILKYSFSDATYQITTSPDWWIYNKWLVNSAQHLYKYNPSNNTNTIVSPMSIVRYISPIVANNKLFYNYENWIWQYENLAYRNDDYTVNQTITTSLQYFNIPCSSVDGNYIYYKNWIDIYKKNSNDSLRWDIIVLSAGNLSRIYPSPNGRYILYNIQNQYLYIKDLLATSDLTPHIFINSNINKFYWTHDWKYIFYTTAFDYKLFRLEVNYSNIYDISNVVNTWLFAELITQAYN